MARADTASASAHPDSIKGLAQSIAEPAYRRLLNAEPLLRRAVPVLIIAFLATICVGALVQVLDHRRQNFASEVLPLEAAADLASERCIAAQETGRRRRAAAAGACASAPFLGSGHRAALILTNPDGVIAAAIPATDATIGRRLIDVLGADATSHDLRRWRGVMEIALPDNSRALATVRMLSVPFGQLAVVQEGRPHSPNGVH